MWELAGMIHVCMVVVTSRGQQVLVEAPGTQFGKILVEHYENNTFTWLLPQIEPSRRGCWVGSHQGPAFWEAVLHDSGSGFIDKLYWAYDTGVPPVEFTKEEDNKS